MVKTSQILKELQAKLAELEARNEKLEARIHEIEHPAKLPAPAPASTLSPAPEPVSEEIMLVIAAAVAAYLGERAHIRVVRLGAVARLGATGTRVDSGIAPSGIEGHMKLNITVDNKNYEVEVEVADHATAPVAAAHHVDTGVRIPAAAPVPASNAASNGAPKVPEGPVNEDKVCRSPVSGIVVRVTSQVGQKIQSGDTLLVLEAMKMETNITAPSAGKIAKINVGQGDAVQGGMVLIEFE